MKLLPRKPSDLRQNLEGKLFAYAKAAGASGIAALALAPQAAAEIVFTPAHLAINPGNMVFLDLDGNGVDDFQLLNSRSHFFGVNIIPQTGSNGIVGTNVFSTFNASALQPGFLVGSVGKFQANPALLAASFRSSSGEAFYLGQWLNVQNRFLGLKFTINGEVHYGWARLSVRSGNFKSTARLTGYAYETTPGAPIRTGQRSDAANSKPVSLGDLALGSAGLQR